MCRGCIWRFFRAVELLLLAGVYYIVWQDRLLNQSLSPEELIHRTLREATSNRQGTSASRGSSPFEKESNTSIPLATINHSRHACGTGYFFAREPLLGPAVVVSIERKITDRSSSNGISRAPSTSRLHLLSSEAGPKSEIQKSCIAQRFSNCGLDLTAVPRMADLFANGTFISVVTNKRTGENSMPDPEVYRRYFLAFECVGVYKSEQDHYALAETWEGKAANKAHPVLTPLHGGVSPARLIGQGRYLLKIAGATSILKILNTKRKKDPEETASKALSGGTFNIVELGCGHAALLAAMCPPVKGVNCYGSDFSPKLIEVGRQYFPWMHLEAHTKAPAVPTGWANLSVSHGVLLCLRLEDVCDHILEGLRVLQPGGKFVLWTLWATPFGSATRLHPGFFVSGVPWDNITAKGYEANITDETNSSRESTFLPYCSNKIGSLVDRVDLWLADESAAIYAPRLNRGGPYGAVLRRSSSGLASHARSDTTPPLFSLITQGKTSFSKDTHDNNSSSLDSVKDVNSSSHMTSFGRSAAAGKPSSNSSAAVSDYFSWYRRFSTLRRFDRTKREWVES
jgi:hypothetical protein